MRNLAAIAILALGLFLSPAAEAAEMSFHDFKFTSIEGKPMSGADFDGKVVLAVNTASFCGFTKQYTDLQALWDKYKGRGLVVLGLPSNDFGQQEPGSSAEIKTFCETNFSVDFPMTEKVKVTGADAHPFYQWAAKHVGVIGSPKWNFHKYLIAPDGHLAEWFATTTSPQSDKVEKAIEKLLPNG